jgi:hypothetical protein
LSDRGLGRGEASDWNPERAAADIIEPEAMTEFHAVWFAAVFSANPELDVWSRLSAKIAGHFH